MYFHKDKRSQKAVNLICRHFLCFHSVGKCIYFVVQFAGHLQFQCLSTTKIENSNRCFPVLFCSKFVCFEFEISVFEMISLNIMLYGHYCAGFCTYVYKMFIKKCKYLNDSSRTGIVHLKNIMPYDIIMEDLLIIMFSLVLSTLAFIFEECTF